MTNISLENPIEVLLAIIFVIIAVLALLASFGVAFAYVFSNIKERWPEYESKRKFQIVRDIAITILIVAALLWLASNRLQ
jgi:predicted membrane metal-binding protein